MRVLINATAAKEGGALVILNQYCCSLVDSPDTHFFLLSPVKPEECPANVLWVRKETNGLASMLFTLFFSWFYVLKYRCSKIVSFSNFNTVFPVPSKVTYFHNLLILVDRGFKYKLIRFILNFCFQKNAMYIFQTPYVQSKFSSVLDLEPSSAVFWPGIKEVGSTEVSQSRLRLDQEKYNVIVPIANLSHRHKNFQLVIDFAVKYSEVIFHVTAEKMDQIYPPNLQFCGVLEHQVLVSLLGQVDGVFISSEYETLCLPIFESLQQNKPAYVLDREYLVGLERLFNGIDGLFKFQESDDFYIMLEQSRLRSYNFPREEYSVGCWDF